MNNSVKDFIFGDGNTMNPVFRQFAMGAVAMAVDRRAAQWRWQRDNAFKRVFGRLL